MELQLDEEQKLILESAQRYVADYTYDKRRSQVTKGVTFDRERWQELAELGWFGIGVSEEAGGYGATTIENTLIAECLAKGQVLEPYTMCGVFPSRVLSAALGHELAQEVLSGLIAGETIVAVAHSEPRSRGDILEIDTVARAAGSGWRLSGRKSLVVGGDVADWLIVSALLEDGEDGHQLGLFLLRSGSEGLAKEGDKLVDWTSGVDIKLDNCLVPREALLASGTKAREILQSAIDETIVVLAAEGVGAIEGAIDITSKYIKERKQFGVALSSFQVLQHRMADMAIELVQTRSAVICGLRALATTGGEERSARVSGCKALVTRSGKWATSQGIQLHGGYGMTEEYQVGQYFKRLLVIDALLGRREFHLGRYTRWMTKAIAQE